MANKMTLLHWAPQRPGPRARASCIKDSLNRMLEHIEFLKVPLKGVDAMSATTSRAFPRHTHDQYGIGVIDVGGHASLSGRGQVEAGAGGLGFWQPGGGA